MTARRKWHEIAMRSAMLALVVSILSVGCSVLGTRPPIPLVREVDLPRYMGDWYVVAFIPIGLERAAHNGIERYDLRPDGSIAITYRYRDGSFDAPLTVRRPSAEVVPGTGNALWGVQFVWPFRSEFRIVHLEPDYSVTIIGRTARDYVWLMARDPVMSDERLEHYRRLIASMGYDASALVRQPQRWPEPTPAPAP